MIDMKDLAKIATLNRFSEDEVFFHEGDPGHEMYIILTGKVEVALNNVDGSALPIAELGPGNFIGEMSLLEGLPRSATIRAMEQTIAAVINENNFQTIMAQQPGLALRIMKGLSSRIRQQNEELKECKSARKSRREPLPTASTDSPPPRLKQFYLAGHSASYNLTTPASDADYVFDKEVSCPVCGKEFQAKMVRSSRLKLAGIDPDFRQRYTGFEPLWYLPWVCPHCYYANLNFAFNQVPEKAGKKILEQNADLKAQIQFKFGDPRTIDQVFDAYYLTLHCIQMAFPDAEKMAKTWLRLCWLYQDAGDEKMALSAAAMALEHFKELYFRQSRETSLEQDQRLTLLLAELSLVIGEREEALKHFRNSVVRKGGSSILNRQAQDRVQELRKQLLDEQKEPDQ